MTVENDKGECFGKHRPSDKACIECVLAEKCKAEVSRDGSLAVEDEEKKEVKK